MTPLFSAKLPSGNKQPVFIDGLRSPFVKSFGVFEDCETMEIFSRVTEGLIRKTGIDRQEIGEIICGAVIPQPKHPNLARDAAIALGLNHVHGYTLNRACTSSLQAVADAAKTIAFGHPTVVLAGGVECLSDVPIVYSKNARRFLVNMSRAKSMSQRASILKEFSAKDWLPSPPGLTEPLTGFSMGEHAEMMAKIYSITREDQDKFALRSHKNASAASEAGHFDDELWPVWPGPEYRKCIDQDNAIRGDSSMEALAKLRPAFDKRHGTITAGNSSPLTDGASVALIADEQHARSLGLVPKVRIKDFIFVGVQPTPELLIGPAIGIPLLLKRNGLNASDISRFEVHEAFAAQVLCCIKAMADKNFAKDKFGDESMALEIPDDCLNVNGGAIAIGHPFAATGTRMIKNLSDELHRSDGQFGVIGVCAAGGMACAMLIERI